MVPPTRRGVLAEASAVRPFRIDVPDAAVADLRRRLAAARFPERETAPDRSQGVQLARLEQPVRYCKTDYDWRKAEARLNALPQFVTEIDGLEVQFAHIRSAHGDALPLIMTHGWPGSVIELLKPGQPFQAGAQPMTQSARALYTGKVRTKGGRDGASRSSDGRLDVKLSTPGTPGSGTNPEQLFAAGWSACFEGALDLAARAMKITPHIDPVIDAEVDLNTGEGGYFLRARLRVSLPGLERDVAQRLIETAHRTCPYSKATRGNVEVAIELV